MFKLDLEKAEVTRERIANIRWIMEKARDFHKKKKKSTSAPVTTLNLWLYESQQTVENSSRDGSAKQPYLFLRNLYSGQEAAVITGHERMDLLKIWKVVQQGWVLSPYLFKLYAKCIMWNPGLHESQSGIKIAGVIATISDI